MKDNSLKAEDPKPFWVFSLRSKPMGIYINGEIIMEGIKVYSLPS
jgi:hypothetical protein